MEEAGLGSTGLLVMTSDHQSFDKRHCYTGGSQVQHYPRLSRYTSLHYPREKYNGYYTTLA